MTVSNISKATGQFHVEPPGAVGTKICSNGPVDMTNMATTPTSDKNL